MKKTIIMCFIFALLIPFLGHANPITAKKVNPAPVAKKEKKITKAPPGQTVVCQNGTQSLAKTGPKAKGVVIAGQSIPCCKRDSQGCICSSDDCDDCADITREVADKSGKACAVLTSSAVTYSLGAALLAVIFA